MNVHNQDPAVIQATFSDWRPVKSRKVLQIILEVPIEETERVLGTLGAPMPAEEKWVAVVLLNTAALVADPGEKPDKPKRRFDEMPRAQQAGIMCADADFRQWLRNVYDLEWQTALQCDETMPNDGDVAAYAVRDICKVGSRTEFDNNYDAAPRWDALLAQYHRDIGRHAEDRG